MKSDGIELPISQPIPSVGPRENEGAARPPLPLPSDRFDPSGEAKPDAPKKPKMDVLEILSHTAPNALQSMREVVRSLAAADRPEVANGLAKTPAGTEAAFLDAANAVLGAERESVRRDIPSAPPAELDPSSGTYKAKGDRPTGSGVKVEVDFSLFFEVSERVSVRGSKDASGSYYEATREVAARFEAGASIKILGDHLDLSDIASRLGDGVFDAFQGAVKGLSGLDDKSLEKFYAASTELFDKIGQAAYGDPDALDSVSAQLNDTAKSFFSAVESGVAEHMGAPGVAPSLFDQGTDLLGLLDTARAAREPKPGDDAPDSPLKRLLASLNALSNHESAQAPKPPADLASLLAA